MKMRLFLFCATVCSILDNCSIVKATESANCNTFLTCVNISQSCGQSFTGECENGSTFGKTFFSIRPQDSNSANRLVRLVNENHTTNTDCRFAWGTDVTLGLQQNFNSKSLGEWFLYNGTNRVTVGIPNNARHFDVDGSQFGLLTEDGSAGLIGTLSLNPTLKNIISNLNFWFDFHKFVPRLWARTYCTIVRAKTNLGMHATTSNVQTTGNYPNSEFTITCSSPSPIVYTSICQAFKGNESFGDIPALQYGKYYGDSKTQTGLASIRFDVGFDVVKSGDGFFNCAACLLAPTANKPQGKYLFEPVLGANKSWQLGIECTGAYKELLDSESTSIDFYTDITLTHLFKSKQTRVFSLKNNGAGSQYLLLKEFDLSVGEVIAGERVANIFAGRASIGANIMLDGSVMLHLTHRRGFLFDLGYNFWLRSKETISKTVCLRNFAKEKYGIKGDLPLSEVDAFSGFCIGNLDTASKSTIGQPAGADATTVALDVCDIDVHAVLHPLAFSNKIFSALGYWCDLHRCTSRMAVSVEGEVEFGHKALNQWALNCNIGFSL